MVELQEGTEYLYYLELSIDCMKAHLYEKVGESDPYYW